MKKLMLFLLCCITWPLHAQLKFVIDDFEGMYDGQKNLSEEGFYTYGAASAMASMERASSRQHIGDVSMKIVQSGRDKYAGFGKGLDRYVDLQAETDHFAMYVLVPMLNKSPETSLTVTISEDDNQDTSFNEYADDVWSYSFKVKKGDQWQLVSVPLSAFKDLNKHGDNIFNASYREGRLFNISFRFNDEVINYGDMVYIDFLSFSKGPLSEPVPLAQSKCGVGFWSVEGNEARFFDIAKSVESTLSAGRKMNIVHFFQPFAQKAGNEKLYPAKDRIQPLIDAGYIPMITLENQYVGESNHKIQPNLYSIIEGHFDYFFKEWASKIKELDGSVLVRILHEFNGDWYPWCIVKNDHNPELYKQAFRHITTIFRQQGAQNVKFVWCPNSMSLPQAPWNNMLLAYPGDDVVDVVGVDVYNGASDGRLWRSFRKEISESYFLLTQHFPSKPFSVCEVSSRERWAGEHGRMEKKQDWIREMSESLKTDFSGTSFICWFNQGKFNVQTSGESAEAFKKFIWNDPFFNVKTSELCRKLCGTDR